MPWAEVCSSKLAPQQIGISAQVQRFGRINSTVYAIASAAAIRSAAKMGMPASASASYSPARCSVWNGSESSTSSAASTTRSATMSASAPATRASPCSTCWQNGMRTRPAAALRTPHRASPARPVTEIAKFDAGYLRTTGWQPSSRFLSIQNRHRYLHLDIEQPQIGAAQRQDPSHRRRWELVSDVSSQRRRQVYPLTSAEKSSSFGK